MEGWAQGAVARGWLIFIPTFYFQTALHITILDIIWSNFFCCLRVANS